MPSNTFGTYFRMTTWGESHGPAVGVVVDGCPAGLPLSEKDINTALAQRKPGMSPYTSPRQEADCAKILSGVFDAMTTGAPISIIIENVDADSEKYEALKSVLRPGHANFTYLEKYGVFDHRGGGRASARETACRVAAGAVAKKMTDALGIGVCAYIHSIANTVCEENYYDFSVCQKRMQSSEIFCPDPIAEDHFTHAVDRARQDGDSVGGVVACVTSKLPIGLGDPVYEKLEAKLAHAMMSLPASKGFEIGEGFFAAQMQGSQHNDSFTHDKLLRSNHAGGTLGGISTGMPLQYRVAFKPTSSIAQPQASCDTAGRAVEFSLPTGSRHDPCVAIRAVPVVQAMTYLVLADCILAQRCARWE